MEEASINTPLYYVLGKEADIDAAARLLALTPCLSGIACSIEEKTLLEYLVQEVLYAKDASECKILAEHVARSTGRSLLIVGEGQGLTAFYSEGDECLYSLT